MSEFEKTVSNLIESQFPSFYYEEGPQFVAFMKAYYEWMEEQGPLYYARRLIDYRDIDTTIDDFLIHFKRKYLSSITMDTAVETERVVKHALDMYRSKGSERAIDLFFKNLFGVEAELYYPGDDVFRTSDGDWFIPQYLEVSASENARSFIGLQVEGIESGATAYVDKYIVKKHKGNPRYTYVYYINRPVGTFIRGEKLRSRKTGAVGPTVLGSVNSLTVTGSSSGYEVGDIVDLVSSGSGIDARGRVTSVATDTGKITFTLVDGGWGYRSNSTVYVSEKVLTVGDVVYDGENADYLETVAQPMVNVTFTAANGTFEVGDTVTRTNSTTGEVYTLGYILDVEYTSNTAGSFLMSVAYGKTDDELDVALEDGGLLLMEDGEVILTESDVLASSTTVGSTPTVSDEDGLDLTTEDDGLFITEAPAVSATIASYDDATVTATLMGVSNTLTVTVSETTLTSFANGDQVYVEGSLFDVANGTIDIVSSDAGLSTMRLLNTAGIFEPGATVLSRTSNAVGTVSSVATSIGVVNIDGDFVDTDGNVLRTLSSNVVATVTRISRGSGANVAISNTFLYTKTVDINTDYLQDYETVDLDASDYGFPTVGTEDINTILGDAMTFVTANVGRISSIITRNQGVDYDTAPFVLVYEPLIAKQDKRDFILDITDQVGDFVAGEVIVQANTEMGLVKSSSNSSTLYLTRLSMEDFQEGVAIVGEQSGSVANVATVSIDTDSMPVGIDALILANTAAGEGVVTGLDVLDSGFNYLDYETVSFSKDGTDGGTAQARLYGHGFSEGYYRSNNGELSGDKYLQDGEYYQEYSYEIRSPIDLDKYVDILKNVIHMAGTKHFSRYVKKSIANSEVTAITSLVIDS